MRRSTVLARLANRRQLNYLLSVHLLKLVNQFAVADLLLHDR